MNLESEIFNKCRDYPPIITKSDFLEVISNYGYNPKIVNKAIEIAQSVHDHDYGHMYYSFIRTIWKGDFFNKDGIISNSTEKLRGAKYTVGHLFPVTLLYLEHKLKNNAKPSLSEIIGLINHDSREDLTPESPRMKALSADKLKGEKEKLSEELKSLDSDSNTIMLSLSNDILGFELTDDYRKLKHFKTSPFDLINMKFCDRLIGTRARMYEVIQFGNRGVNTQYRRANTFMNFANHNPGLVLDSIKEELRKEIEIMEKYI